MSRTRVRSTMAWWLGVLAVPVLSGCMSMMTAVGGGMTPELQAAGEPAVAEILELWDTGWTINDSPVIGMKVRVIPESGETFEATIEKTTISRLSVSQFQPGNVIPVRFDPQNRGAVAVDPDPPQRAAKPSTGNPYRDEFESVRQAGVGLMPPPAEPELFLGTGDSAADAQSLYERNYALLGGSGVHGGDDLRQAIEHGRDIGAALIVVYGNYPVAAGESLEILPYRPRPLEAGAAVPAVRSGLFSNLGQGDRFAAYWGKSRPPVLGVVIRPRNAAEQERYAEGVIIDAVASESPAADAGLAAGDVIFAIDGESVDDALAMPALLQARAGKAVRIQVLRNGSPMAVTAQLNPAAP